MKRTSMIAPSARPAAAPVLVAAVFAALVVAQSSLAAQRAAQDLSPPIPSPVARPAIIPPAAAPAPAVPAASQTARPAPRGGGSMLPGGDSREPIFIDADKLEWFDREQKAIYTGSVVARQGEATLKSTQLRIFLVKGQKGAPAPAAPNAPAPAVTANGAAPPAPAAPQAPGPMVGDDNQIERMEADGPVELIQKDQTATGDSGVYERGSNAVTLIGHVALRQGGHVTYGDRLVYDLDSRQAVVQNPRGTFAPRSAPASAPAPKR
jgi:lipopolysaccharide export system protein LptA